MAAWWQHVLGALGLAEPAPTEDRGSPAAALARIVPAARRLVLDRTGTRAALFPELTRSLLRLASADLAVSRLRCQDLEDSVRLVLQSGPRTFKVRFPLVQGFVREEQVVAFLNQVAFELNCTRRFVFLSAPFGAREPVIVYVSRLEAHRLEKLERGATLQGLRAEPEPGR